MPRKKPTNRELLQQDYEVIQKITKEHGDNIIVRAQKIKEYLAFPEKYWSK